MSSDDKAFAIAAVSFVFGIPAMLICGLGGAICAAIAISAIALSGRRE